jgi:regulator of replication initiation timing
MVVSMTKDEALKLALEALKQIDEAMPFPVAKLAQAAIKKALAQPEQLREENERLHVENRRLIDRIESIGVPVGVGGFATTTSQRTWVGLTPDELNAIFDGFKTWSSFQITDVYFAIEAKLKEKNT